MVLTQSSEAARIRSRLNHPVVDSDGHMLEVNPVLHDFIRQVGGSRVMEKLARHQQGPWEGQFDRSSWAAWERLNAQERRDTGTPAQFWWSLPTDAYYRATSNMPRLWYQRMEEFGLDFCIVFPTSAIGFF